MTLDKLSQITEVGIKSGITLRNINVEDAYISGVVTATSLDISEAFSIAGVITATSFDGNVIGNINPSTLNVTGVSTFQASSHWGDGDIAYFGTDDDLLIFHNSTDSIIRDTGTGDLFIQGGNRIKMTNPTGIETYAVFNQDGAVELWFDNSKKLETTGAGVTAYGSISVGSNFIGNNAVGLGQTTTTGRNAGVGTAVGTIIYNSTSSTVEVWNGNRWAAVGEAFIQATGGTISDYTSGGTVYRSHIFTSSGTFSVTSVPAINNTVDYLVVAGGGGGGTGLGGGGGAGGFRTGTGLPVSATPGSYSITVGSGGAFGSSTPVLGSNGSDSIFSSITSTGGGRGSQQSAPSPGGAPGGSGGGGSRNYTSGGSGNTPPVSPPQGNNGGSGTSSAPGYSGGGGGGAASVGSDGTTSIGGNGGAGQSSSITGISTHYAGGGGGGSYQTSNSSGGIGGGGNGMGTETGPSAPNGVMSTGSGGGGGGNNSAPSQFGGSGGSGIVVVRYPIGNLTASAKATGGFISYTPTTTVHTFLSSGTFTVTNPSLTSVDYLVVGGGGAGASDNGSINGNGGGGAGALKYGSSPVSSTSYSVTVGAGGQGGLPVSGNNKPGTSSSINFPSTITSPGGGSGGYYSSQPGGPGGSGGGGGASGGTGGSATGSPGGTNESISPGIGWGNNGASGSPSGGGGGGGAGAIASGRTGGNGLAYSISGTSVTYAGGGGASGPSPGLGGSGGGGNGAQPGTGGNGTVNTGGGGGGGLSANGAGGSGIVIITYPS